MGRGSARFTLEDVRKLNPRNQAEVHTALGYDIPPKKNSGPSGEKKGKIDVAALVGAPNPNPKPMTTADLAAAKKVLDGHRVPSWKLAGFRSKWEEEWSELPETKRRFDSLQYEAMTLELATRAKYTPDFIGVVMKKIVEDDSELPEITAIEVKGFWREAARVRIKVAARLFPWITFIAVRKRKKKDGGGWEEETIAP